MALLATVHGASVEELKQKPLYAALLREAVFSKAVVISQGPEGRCYRVEDMPWC